MNFQFHGRYCPTSILVVLLLSCQTKQTSPALPDIDLLRGDVTLCGAGTGSFGAVSFQVNSKADVAESFNMAMALLHSFEYEESEKAFVNVIDKDPNCAMAYWGIAMSNFHSLWLQSGTDYLVKGAQIIEASHAIPKTEKEADYLHAIAGFYDDWKTRSHLERVKEFEKRMKALHEKYPDDKEATIFYALSLTASADPSDRGYTNQRLSGKLLESIFPEQPDHPGIAHYLIHNYDYPELAELALPTARRYAQIAPASAHAQHMPSHIFTRLGLWDEDIRSNISSVAAALCYASSMDSSAHWDEELHGMDYLVYAYLQRGENAKAEEQYAYLKTFERVFPVNFKIAYAIAAIPSRIYLENHDWKGASGVEMPSVKVDWTMFPWQQSILHFARGLGAARSGNINLAESELSILKTNQQALLDKGENYQANQVAIQLRTLSAWIALAKGKETEAIEWMKEAARMEYGTAKHPVTPGEVLPAGELLGDLLMVSRHPAEALGAYEYDLSQHPNRFNGTYGAAIASAALGNRQKARSYFQKLLALAPESGRAEIKKAREFLKP